MSGENTLKKHKKRKKETKKEIEEKYIKMRDCNRLGIKKEEVEIGVEGGKIRIKKFLGEIYYYREDIANLI